MPLVSALALTLSLAAGRPLIDTRADHVALRGYDTVAYFVDARAVRGDERFSAVWRGATWRFASAEHRDRFVREPDKYAPQFGGYCAWAIGHGYVAEGDPEAWTIVDGRLYLNFSPRLRDLWTDNVRAHIRQAEANWPAVLEK